MEVHFVEAGNGFNWGKFAIFRFEEAEWAYRSMVDGRGLIAGQGWGPEHLVVLDLATGEGAVFHPGGVAAADLTKHRIHVCPLFEPFLEWLYVQDLSDLSALPNVVDLPDAPAAMYGHRRPGPSQETTHG